MKLTKIALATVLAAGLMSTFSTVALAETVSQNQKQELEVVCEVGAYGQATNCRAKGTQEQTQNVTLDRTKVVYIRGKAVLGHSVVDTAMDPKVMIVGSLVILAGITALALKTKTR